ncbi:MAG TPA: TonB-dependent receptor [Bryobacteraceae bacterium]|nr:TonB-dependent receptor [Bryobacteraceae bacterium]
MSFLSSFVALSSAVLLWTASLGAQFTTASLGGTVLDASGAAVPQSTVTILNKDTGFTKTGTSADDGSFIFPGLPVGNYRLTIEKTGFSTYVQEGIQLTVNQAASQTATLQVGSGTQAITITADAAMLNTQMATISQLVSERQVTSLPLNGRTAQSLVFIAAGTVDASAVPGVRESGQGGLYPGEQMAAVSGGGSKNVNYQMDGAGHNDTYVNMNLPFPNPDAIQEFNLQSSSMSAEYGGAAATVNIITKSGTNVLHGSAFEFLRNGAMNARNFFAPTQDTLKRNQFGATAGGPIKKDELFFFGTYQGTRIRSAPAGRIAFVPTAAERSGEFPGTSKQLMDPNTGTPFPGNRIPLSLFSGPAKYFLNRIPLPNGPGQELTYQGPSAAQRDDQLMGKIDWMRKMNRVSGRYFYTKFTQKPDFEGVKKNLLAMDSGGNEVRVQTLALDHVLTASPTVLFNTWFGWNSQVGGSRSGIPDSADAITFPAAGVKIAGGATGIPPAIEGLNVSGFFNAGSTHFGDFNRGDWRIREGVTVVRGSHELIVGGEVARLLQDIKNTNTQSGVFTFSNQLSGSNLVDFLLGAATQFNQGAGQYQNLRGTTYSLFVQDNWRVTQRLMLNLGVRWDPYWPYSEIKNRIPCFLPGQKSSRYPNAPAGLVFGGDPGCPAGSGQDATLANVAPRLGFAYRISPKMSIRGGAGVYYSIPASLTYNGTAATAPFNPRFLLTRVSFEDPYGSAGIVNPFPAQYGAGSVQGPEAQFTLPTQVNKSFGKETRLGTLGTWNLTLERQLGASWLLSASYLGNGGYHLYGSTELNPAIYIPGASTVGNTQARRRVQGISTVSGVRTDFNSHYHSLQLNVEKRFSSGLSLLANYAWSKKIDNLASTNPYNRNFDHGLANEHVPHIFHLTTVWMIPAPGLRGIAGGVFQGWGLTSLTTWRGGFPFSVGSGRDNAFSGVGSDRADFIGSGLQQAKLSGQSHAQQIQRFFDTSLFVPNAIGTFGNSGRNILVGPRFFDTDLGLTKDIHITEKSNVQFRAEFFNVFNNVNFSNPGSTLGSASLGKITSASDPRILQLALKFMF